MRYLVMKLMAVETNILPSSWAGADGVSKILKLVLGILVYGIGAAAVLGLVITGIQYMTARDNEAQMTAAKKRIFDIVLGLVAWAAMFGLLNWLIPGGITINKLLN